MRRGVVSRQQVGERAAGSSVVYPASMREAGEESMKAGVPTSPEARQP